MKDTIAELDARATMEPLPISVCMISGAEAHRIARALSSVRGWVSEIIVVLNQEVNDGTAEIVLAHGGQVFREPWGGFVKQKNSASAKATQPWLLGLDADEEVPPALREEIARTLASPGQHAAFNMPRCTQYCGRWIRHGDWYPDRVIRLWRANAAQWVGVEPHARLHVNGSIGRLKNDLLHFSNESIDHQLSKIAPYSTDFVQHRLAAGQGTSTLELTIRPLWRFVRAYVFRLGFLDGWRGYYIASLTAFAALTRYTKIREAQWKDRKQS